MLLFTFQSLSLPSFFLSMVNCEHLAMILKQIPDLDTLQRRCMSFLHVCVREYVDKYVCVSEDDNHLFSSQGTLV